MKLETFLRNLSIPYHGSAMSLFHAFMDTVETPVPAEEAVELYGMMKRQIENGFPIRDYNSNLEG
jgi:hypothetical protein